MKTQTFTLLVTVHGAFFDAQTFADHVCTLLEDGNDKLPGFTSALVDAQKGIHATAFDQETRATHRHADF